MLKKTPLKRKSTSIKKISDKQKIKNEEKREQTKLRQLLFLEIWDEREETDSAGNKFVRCFETGKRMSRGFYRLNSCCYHHVLHKEKHPEFDLVKENIIILMPDVHAQVHTNIDKTPKVKEKTQELVYEFFEEKSKEILKKIQENPDLFFN